MPVTGVDDHAELFDAMLAFLKLTLLFHSGAPWDHDKQNAPNTPGKEIRFGGPYHQVSSIEYGIEASTVDNGSHGVAMCRKCKSVAMPAHVTDAGKRGALAVWCTAHCPACTKHRRTLAQGGRLATAAGKDKAGSD